MRFTASKLLKFLQWLVPVSLILILSISGIANAHILKTDGTMSALLHSDPNDAPISNVPTIYVLFFEDTTHKFNLDYCNCRVVIKEGGKTLKIQKLAPTDPLYSKNTFTFPKADIYSLQITGQPTQTGAFQAFRLAYSLRVEQGPTTTRPWLWVGAGGVVALLLATMYITIHKAKRPGGKNQS